MGCLTVQANIVLIESSMMDEVDEGKEGEGAQAFLRRCIALRCITL